MEFSAGQIAEMLGGRVDGDPGVKVNTLSKIEEGTLGTLTFLANSKYESFIYDTAASVAIVNEDFTAQRALPVGLTLIRVSDAYSAFAKLLEAYNTYKKKKVGRESTAVVDPSASVHADTYLGHHVVVSAGASIGAGSILHAGCYIGQGASIGANCLLHPGSKVLDDCVVGDACTLHAGAVIGSDGFGFASDAANNYKKVPQIGKVILEDHVEVGANTTVDRATLGSTILRRGVKLDNLIQIAHNVEIGENTVIAAQTGIAGSTRIGRNCMIGGQVGIVGHIHIADDVKIAAQSGIGSSIVKQGSILQGSPAFEIRSFKQAYIGFRKLPKFEARLEHLEKQINTPDNGSEAHE